MYQPHEDQSPNFLEATAICRNRNQGSCIPFKRALIAVAIASLSLMVTGMPAQRDTSRLLSPDLPRQDTVSTNQLLTPRKALEATRRAHNKLVAGQLNEAQKEIKRALDISPHCALALNIQGAIQLRTGNLGDAADTFHEAIEADPSLGSAQLGLAMALIARDRLEDALAPLDRATNLLPNSWLVHFETAITHLGLGDADAALKQIDLAAHFTENEPERSAATVYLRGLAYVRLKDYVNARKYFGDAVAFDPNGFYAPLALKRLDQLRPLRVNGK